MDINDLRGISTLLLMLAFLGICVWAYGKKQRKGFEEAAELPFADEAPEKQDSEGRQEDHT
jgi:cytochrome c oxidase cbb3-type subunit 4